MICASRPNFYKANSSLSELFLHVSLNDLWLPSQFLQHKLIIKWNTPYMLRCMNCGSCPNFCGQNEIIKWAALVAWLRLADVCNKAFVSHHLEKAAEVAVAFGMAVPEEFINSEVADEICNQAVMKPLGRKRFLVLLRPR